MCVVVRASRFCADACMQADRTTIHKGEWSVFWVGLGVFTAFWAGTNRSFTRVCPVL